MNWTEDEDRSFFVPARIAESCAAVSVGMRFERPCSIGAELGGDAEFAKHRLRFGVAGDDQRIMHEAGAHIRDELVHVPSLCTVSDGEFIF